MMTRSRAWQSQKPGESPPAGRILLGITALIVAVLFVSDALAPWSAASDSARGLFPWLALAIGAGGIVVLIGGIRGLRVHRDR